MRRDAPSLSRLHGGEVEWAVSERYNIPIENILSFASTVSPLVPKSLSQIAGTSSRLSLYSPSEQRQLKSAIIDYHHAKKGTKIILGCGSTELIHLIGQAMSRGEVVIPIPTYGEYSYAVKRYGGVPVLVNPLTGFDLDIPAIKSAITQRTKAIMICNPNNPTGKLFDWTDIVEIAEYANARGILLVVDEAYACFSPLGRSQSATKLIGSHRVLVLNSLSKLFGVPAIRLGWGLGSEETIRELEALKIPWTISNIAAWAGRTLLQDERYQHDTLKLIERQKLEIINDLSHIPWLSVLPSETNFFLIKITAPNVTSTDVFERLVEKGLVIRDCRSMDGLGNKYFRITVRTAEQNAILISELMKIEVPTLAVGPSLVSLD